jgi:hypothetical protein
MHILADDTIKSATLAATSTASGFSVNNLKNDRRASTWRSTAITSQTITATWSSAQTINFVGIAFANFLVGSTVRARLFTNTGDASPVVDSGVKTIDFVYPPPAGFSANNLSCFAYGGGNYYSLQVTQAAVKKLELILVNPSGVDAFIETSRIVAGKSVDFSNCLNYGASFGLDDLTQARRTDGGNLIIDRRPVARSASLNLSMLNPTERAAMREIMRKNGRHTPVYISAHESAADSATRTDMQIYGNFDDLSGMSLDAALYSSVGLKIQEI